MSKQPMIAGEDYVIENGNVVFTSTYHIKRSFCCGNGCKNCPFEPKNIKNNTKR